MCSCTAIIIIILLLLRLWVWDAAAGGGDGGGTPLWHGSMEGKRAPERGIGNCGYKINTRVPKRNRQHHSEEQQNVNLLSSIPIALVLHFVRIQIEWSGLNK